MTSKTGDKIGQKLELGWENPIGVDGFDFVEIATTNPTEVFEVFRRFGFRLKAQHPTRKVYHMAQGEINIIVNNEPQSYAYKYAEKHGHSIMAQGYRVKDAEKALVEAVKRGARPFCDMQIGDLHLPAIYGVGDGLIYFVDDNGRKRLYEENYEMVPTFKDEKTAGLKFIDHLDHNVQEGQLKAYEDFYTKIFNFKEARYWEIEGEQTAINSKAFISPCGKILIPVIQSGGGNSYVKEYLELYHGEGIQHVAFYAEDICSSIEYMREKGQNFMEVRESYYDDAKDRLPKNHKEYDRIKKNFILIDGNGKEYMLQIFTTKDCMNPLFFEFIERGGYQGFGERNFPALFDVLEQDQIKRGYLKSE